MIDQALFAVQKTQLEDVSDEEDRKRTQEHRKAIVHASLEAAGTANVAVGDAVGIQIGPKNVHDLAGRVPVELLCEMIDGFEIVMIKPGAQLGGATLGKRGCVRP